MAALDNTRATGLLQGILALGTSPSATTSEKIRLGTGTLPTASAAMTEITGTGYTAGGSAIAWNAVSGTPPTSTNSAAITWTNTSGSAWSITGAEIWDIAGTPLRWLFGAWNGQPISVANNNAFQLASAGASASLS